MWVRSVHVPSKETRELSVSPPQHPFCTLWTSLLHTPALNTLIFLELKGAGCYEVSHLDEYQWAILPLMPNFRSYGLTLGTRKAGCGHRVPWQQPSSQTVSHSTLPLQPLPILQLFHTDPVHETHLNLGFPCWSCSLSPSLLYTWWLHLSRWYMADTPILGDPCTLSSLDCRDQPLYSWPWQT